MNVEKEIFDVSEIMKILKCDRKQVMKYRKKYYLPLYNEKNKLVINKSDFSKWINKMDDIKKEKQQDYQRNIQFMIIFICMIAFLLFLFLLPDFVTNFVFLFIIYFVIYNIFEGIKRKRIEKLKIYTFKYDFITIQNFKDIRKNLKEFSGIYIFYNKTKNKHYVGQSIHVIERISDHLKGKGSKSLYVDYLCKDNIFLKYININDTNYRSLNKLERDAIVAFDSYTIGYNLNRGNK